MIVPALSTVAVALPMTTPAQGLTMRPLELLVMPLLPAPPKPPTTPELISVPPAASDRLPEIVPMLVNVPLSIIVLVKV